MEPKLLRVNNFEKNSNSLNCKNHYIYSILDSRPAIDVQYVNFGYKKNTLILNNLSIKIPKGKQFKNYSN